MDTNRKNFIPFGLFCYDKEGLCPHYEAKKVNKNIIDEAFCHFKGCSDFKLNEKEKICKQNLS